MNQLLRLYRQTEDAPTGALYLVVWLRLACDLGRMSKDQVLRALRGDADAMATLLSLAQPGLVKSEAIEVLKVLEKELAT